MKGGMGIELVEVILLLLHCLGLMRHRSVWSKTICLLDALLNNNRVPSEISCWANHKFLLFSFGLKVHFFPTVSLLLIISRFPLSHVFLTSILKKKILFPFCSSMSCVLPNCQHVEVLISVCCVNLSFFAPSFPFPFLSSFLTLTLFPHHFWPCHQRILPFLQVSFSLFFKSTFS